MTLNKLRINANEKGFTLIELMIVIAIIGILAAIAIPNFISYRDKAYCSSAESDANAIAQGIADYFAIPTHTTLGDLSGTNTISIANAGTGINGLTLPSLSGSNTATIAGGVSSIRITVTDASGRCPSDYQSAQTEWDGSNNFTKVMQ